MLWEDYLRLVEVKRIAKIHAPKTRAREEIIEISGICDKTFYAIRDRLKDLCDDV